MIYNNNHTCHTVRFDCSKRIKRAGVEEEELETITYYGELCNEDFHNLKLGKSREEAILEMTISSLNRTHIFSEPIDHNNFEDISQIFLDQARIS